MFAILAWVFVAAVAVHNLEEAIYLPAWTVRARRWHRRVGAGEFRFAVFVLTTLTGAAALLATVQGWESFGAYLLSGYALAMLLNVAFPHVLATIATRRYMPGTATAIVLVLPAAAGLLHHALRQGFISPATFAFAWPAVVIAIVLLIPALFAIGRRLASNATRRASD